MGILTFQTISNPVTQRAQRRRQVTQPKAWPHTPMRA